MIPCSSFYLLQGTVLTHATREHVHQSNCPPTGEQAEGTATHQEPHLRERLGPTDRHRGSEKTGHGSLKRRCFFSGRWSDGWKKLKFNMLISGKLKHVDVVYRSGYSLLVGDL